MKDETPCSHRPDRCFDPGPNHLYVYCRVHLSLDPGKANLTFFLNQRTEAPIRKKESTSIILQFKFLTCLCKQNLCQKYACTKLLEDKQNKKQAQIFVHNLFILHEVI